MQRFFIVFLTLIGLLIITQPTFATSDGWNGAYYNNTSWSGAPVHYRHDPYLKFGWGNARPAPNVNSNNFSVRWTRTVTVDQPTDYHLQLSPGQDNDIMEFYVDGQLRLRKDFNFIPKSAEIHLAPGTHYLEIRYAHYNYGAYVEAQFYQLPPVPTTGWRAEYFEGTTSTHPVAHDTVAELKFNWGTGAPASLAPESFASGRWTGFVTVEQQRVYRFVGYTTGWVQLWVDDQMMHIERDGNHFRAENVLTPGTHRVRLLFNAPTEGQRVLQMDIVPIGTPPMQLLSKVGYLSATDGVVAQTASSTFPLQAGDTIPASLGRGKTFVSTQGSLTIRAGSIGSLIVPEIVENVVLIEDTATGTEIGAYRVARNATVTAFTVDGDYVYFGWNPHSRYVTSCSGMIDVIDISDPTNPTLVTQWGQGAGFAKDILIENGIAYVSMGCELTFEGVYYPDYTEKLFVLDVRSLSDIRQLMMSDLYTRSSYFDGVLTRWNGYLWVQVGAEQWIIFE